MGSEISSFIAEPLIGTGVIALLIFAIIEQNRNNPSAAMWSTIAAIVLTFILVAVNIFLSMYG